MLRPCWWRWWRCVALRLDGVPSAGRSPPGAWSSLHLRRARRSRSRSARPATCSSTRRTAGCWRSRATPRYPRGLFTYDGRGWHQLATVCGGPGDTARIAFAGPARVLDRERAEPSALRLGHGALPLQGRPGGRLLQHAARVVRPLSPDAGRRLQRAQRLLVRRRRRPGPDRRAGRRLPPALERVDPRDRLRATGQGRHATSRATPARSSRASWSVCAAGDLSAPDLAEPEPDPSDPAHRPRLLHRIVGGRLPERAVPGDRGSATAADGERAARARLRRQPALGGRRWSGVGPVRRPRRRLGPAAAARRSGSKATSGASYRSTRCRSPSNERFVDVAAVPATDSAWVAVTSVDKAQSHTEKAKVARIAADGSVPTG